MRFALNRAGAGLVAAAVTCLTLAMTATPAAAHTKLESSDPRQGARFDDAPAQVELVFTDAVHGRYTQVGVRGPDGENYESGPPRTAGGKITQPLLPLGPAGKYQIGYRVVAPDGHPVTGTLDFTLTRAGEARPSAAPPTGTGGGAASAGGSGGEARSGEGTGDGPPGWVLMAGAFTAIALAGAVVALRRGRRSRA